MFVKRNELTENDKSKISEMMGKIVLWMLEERSIGYASKELKLHPNEILENIDETLYEFRKHVGRWRYFKILFWK